MDISDLHAFLATPLGAKFLDVVAKGTGLLFDHRFALKHAEQQVAVSKVLTQGKIETDRMEALGKIETDRLVAEQKARHAAEAAAALPRPPDLVLTSRTAPQLVVHEVGDDENAIDVEFDEPKALAARAERRGTYQEMKRQENIDATCRDAVHILATATQDGASDEPVDDDWTARFFGHVQDVSNEQMRKLWAKILAGEVVRPGSFSLRTLDRMRNLTATEAALFTQIAPCICNDAWVPQSHLLEELKLYPVDILTLVEAGLLAAAMDLEVTITSRTQRHYACNIVMRAGTLIIVGETPDPTLNFEVYGLTEAGRQLASLQGDRAAERMFADAFATKVRELGFNATLVTPASDTDPTASAGPNGSSRYVDGEG